MNLTNNQANEAQHWATLSVTRFLLAMIVVLGHFTFFLKHETLHLFGDGYLNPLSAVFGFFVLSGYSISASLDRNTRGFYKRRFIRIWPLFLIAIAFGLAVYMLLPVSFRWPLGEELPPVTKSDVLSSTLMLQNIVGDSISIVAVIWSLSTEWWLYMAAPVLKKKSALFLGGLIFISFCYFIDRHPYNPSAFAVGGWAEWKHGRTLLGLSWLWITGFIYNRYKGTPTGFFILFAPALAALFLGRTPGLPFFITAFILVLSYNFSLPLLTMRCFNFLGDLSYPIYLLHIPTMVAAVALGITDRLSIMLAIILVSTAALCLIDYRKWTFQRPKLAEVTKLR